MFTKKILNFGLLFLVAFIFTFFIQTKDAKAQVIPGLFMYWYGGVDSRLYAILPELVVVNTTHGYWGGPYTSSDVADLKAAGIKVVGYTTVSYTNRAISLLQDEIIGMAQSDSVDGIFLDECPADPGPSLTQASYLKGLADLAHSYGKFIWCNPGLNGFGSWYITTGGFDYIQATEHWEQAGNQVSSPYASQVSVAGFNSSITESEAVRLTRLAWSMGYRFVYLNDAEYTTMASWFQQYAIDLGGGSVGTCSDPGLSAPVINPSNLTSNDYPVITCSVALTAGNDCISVEVDDDPNICTFNSWSGNNAIFWCNLAMEGTHTAKCKSVAGTSYNCCAGETIKTYTVTGGNGGTTYSLSVGKAGNGAGIVTGSGIDCGTSCFRTYSIGASVTLTAIANNADSVFAGWSGDCSGTGACIMSMTAIKSVTATFNSVGGQPSPTGVDCLGSTFDTSNLKTYQVGSKTVSYDGLVPCGKCALVDDNPIYVSCQLCHLFIIVKGIFDFVLFRIIPIVAILLVVIGGVMYVVSAGNAGMLNRAKSIIISTLIGLAIILATWLIINTVFTFIGVSEWTGLKEGWFQIDCEITLPTQ